MKTMTKVTHPTVALFALASFAVSPAARATCQEGCIGNENTVLGNSALLSNTTGSGNTAIGNFALSDNSTGSDNTAVGNSALELNTTGSNNIAIGFGALGVNTTGTQNMAIGNFALSDNDTGSFNTATGSSALQRNGTGMQNTATGDGALSGNNSGNANTATGNLALSSNRTGSNNVVDGAFAMTDNVMGGSNTAIGVNALAHSKGDNNIALGHEAGVNIRGSGDANIAIGNPGLRNDAGIIRIGEAGIHTNTYIAGISGVTVAAGIGVMIDPDGHLGTVVSSERFKDAVRPMDKASEAILALQPVTFRYKKQLDPAAIPQFGLVAEQVAKVDPDLVARDADGKPYSVRYEAVNAMLLNEFLKEHKKVEEQANKIDQLEAELQRVTDRLNAEGL